MEKLTNANGQHCSIISNYSEDVVFDTGNVIYITNQTEYDEWISGNMDVGDKAVGIYQDILVKLTKGNGT